MGHPAYVHAAVYTTDQWILKESGESRAHAGDLLHVLQLLPCASDVARDTCYGSGSKRSCLECGGTCGSLRVPLNPSWLTAKCLTASFSMSSSRRSCDSGCAVRRNVSPFLRHNSANFGLFQNACGFGCGICFILLCDVIRNELHPWRC